MNELNAPPTVLTQEELQTIAAFVAALQDSGVVALLTINACSDIDCEDVTTISAINTAIADLTKTCEVSEYTVSNVDKIYDAAPSLSLVVGLVTDFVDADFFPEGCIPENDTIKKCLDEFFRRVRAEALPSQ